MDLGGIGDMSKGKLENRQSPASRPQNPCVCGKCKYCKKRARYRRWYERNWHLCTMVGARFKRLKERENERAKRVTSGVCS